jgi:hypothetical protein
LTPLLLLKMRLPVITGAGADAAAEFAEIRLGHDPEEDNYTLPDIARCCRALLETRWLAA